MYSLTNFQNTEETVVGKPLCRYCTLHWRTSIRSFPSFHQLSAIDSVLILTPRLLSVGCGYLHNQTVYTSSFLLKHVSGSVQFILQAQYDRTSYYSWPFQVSAMPRLFISGFYVNVFRSSIGAYLVGQYAVTLLQVGNCIQRWNVRDSDKVNFLWRVSFSSNTTII